jgi:hypothetical protein
MFNLFDIHDSDPMFKLFKESSSVCTDADRQLEASINARLERGSVSMYSLPTGFGMVYSWKGRNHLIEQDQPFDCDEVVAKAEAWASVLENSGLPPGWSRTP